MIMNWLCGYVKTLTHSVPYNSWLMDVYSSKYGDTMRMHFGPGCGDGRGDSS